MKRFFPILLILLCFFSCKEKNRSIQYNIYQISFQPTIGTIYVNDLGEGRVEIDIQLTPIVDGKYPTHLHFGNTNIIGKLAYQLSDLDGKTGRSRTVLNNVKLSNGEILTFDKVLEMDGSIKIHMDTFTLKDAVIAFGNVGKNDNSLTLGMSVCTNH